MENHNHSILQTTSTSTVILNTNKRPNAWAEYLKTKIKVKAVDTMDEYIIYCENTAMSVPHDVADFNLIKWWQSQEAQYPNLAKFAYDMLSIPGITAKCERVFSGAKRLITQDRNSLKEDVIEANKYLRA